MARMSFGWVLTQRSETKPDCARVCITRPTLDAIRDAHERFRDKVNRTPSMTSEPLDSQANTELFFSARTSRESVRSMSAGPPRGTRRCRSLQWRCHAFVRQPRRRPSPCPKLRGILPHIVMRKTAPPAKVECVLRYRGNIPFCLFCEPTLEARVIAASRTRGRHARRSFEAAHIIPSVNPKPLPTARCVVLTSFILSLNQGVRTRDQLPFHRSSLSNQAPSRCQRGGWLMSWAVNMPMSELVNGRERELSGRSRERGRAMGSGVNTRRVE
jgi:hypothetical protein